MCCAPCVPFPKGNKWRRATWKFSETILVKTHQAIFEGSHPSFEARTGHPNSWCVVNAFQVHLVNVSCHCLCCGRREARGGLKEILHKSWRWVNDWNALRENAISPHFTAWVQLENSPLVLLSKWKTMKKLAWKCAFRGNIHWFLHFWFVCQHNLVPLEEATRWLCICPAPRCGLEDFEFPQANWHSPRFCSKFFNCIDIFLWVLLQMWRHVHGSEHITTVWCKKKMIMFLFLQVNKKWKEACNWNALWELKCQEIQLGTETRDLVFKFCHFFNPLPVEPTCELCDHDHSSVLPQLQLAHSNFFCQTYHWPPQNLIGRKFTGKIYTSDPTGLRASVTSLIAQDMGTGRHAPAAMNGVIHAK